MGKLWELIKMPFKWFWFTATLKTKLVIGGIILLVIVVAFGFSWCSKRRAKIDLESVDKINSKNEKERKAELQKVIENNANVVRTVDNRTELTEINIIERNREIDAKVREVNQKIIDAKNNGRDVTQDELQCMLVPEDCQ